jgi:hypothetical protein
MEGFPLAHTNRSYVEHVAIHVKDVPWHIRFFYEALGMPVYRLQGPEDSPQQAWTVGGIQLVAQGEGAETTSLVGHIGVVTENLEEAIRAVTAWGARETPKGRHWLQLPEGLVIELIQAHGNSVAEALAVNPRG